MKIYKYFVASLALFSSCTFLDVEPTGKVIPTTTSEYRALMTSAYSKFPPYKRILTIRSDEVHPSGVLYSNYKDIASWNDVGANPLTLPLPWTTMYNVIFYTNSVISGVATAALDSRSDTREQIKGEAHLLRAYAHFELMNLYARPYDKTTAATDRGVPISLVTDIDQQFIPATIEKVYAQVFDDIAQGLKLMTVQDQTPATRYRFALKSAKALEARVRLYHRDWDQAYAAALSILDQCPLEDFNVTAGFVAPYTPASKEAILSMESPLGVIGDDMAMMTDFLTKYADGKRDLRKDVYFPVKYDEISIGKFRANNDKVTIRSAEIYLIAAEAAANIDGKLTQAKEHLKVLLGKRLSPAYFTERAAQIDAMTKDAFLAEVMEERARELALEGHRWYDLRRTTRPKIVKAYSYLNLETFETIDEKFTLEENDKRYTIPFPREAVENNPNLRD